MAVLRPLLGTSDYLEGYDLFRFCDEEDDTVAEQAEREPEARFAGLAKTIETEIVPRLMLAHRAELTSHRAVTDGSLEPSEEDIKAFAAIVVRKDLESARRFVADMQERGTSIEKVFLALMAPTARYLGDLWVEDRLDFASVTLGLSRLQQLLRVLSREFGQAGGSAERRVLLITYPGEQHTFGLYMVAEFFRRDGWDVWGGPPDSEEAVFDLVAEDWFDVFGISVSLDSNLNQLGDLIQGVRKASRNGAIRTLAGGRALGGNEELAVKHGADGAAVDGRDALHRAQELISRTQRVWA